MRKEFCPWLLGVCPVLQEYGNIYDLSGWFGVRKEFCPWLLGVCPVLQEYGNIYDLSGWFGVRKEFCPWLLGVCPVLQEYGNIYDLSGWFGLRKEFCPWLLGVCPVLQEYGNISYKIQTDTTRDTERGSMARETAKKTSPRAKKGPTIEDSSRTVVPVVSIDVPD